MKRLFQFWETIYYYLKSSYKIWRVKGVEKDDIAYTTQSGVEVRVYKGKKTQSPYDFIVKHKEPDKRERTPRHIHLIVEMYVKHAFNPGLTLELRDHFLEVFDQIKPIDYFPPRLQIFRPEHAEGFKELDKVGEFTVEFMLVATELIMIQEKTNYPQGSLTRQLYENFGLKDRFSVINSAVFGRRKS